MASPAVPVAFDETKSNERPPPMIAATAIPVESVQIVELIAPATLDAGTSQCCVILCVLFLLRLYFGVELCVHKITALSIDNDVLPKSRDFRRVSFFQVEHKYILISPIY